MSDKEPYYLSFYELKFERMYVLIEHIQYGYMAHTYSTLCFRTRIWFYIKKYIITTVNYLVISFWLFVSFFAFTRTAHSFGEHQKRKMRLKAAKLSKTHEESKKKKELQKKLATNAWKRQKQKIISALT